MSNNWYTPKGMKEHLAFYNVPLDEIKRCDKYENGFTAKRILKPGYDVLFPASVYAEKIIDHLYGAEIMEVKEREDAITGYKIIEITYQFPGTGK